MSKIVSFVLAIALSFSLSPSYTKAASWENWNDTKANIKLNQKFTIKLHNQLRFHDVVFSDYYIIAVRAGLSYKICRNLSVFAAYRNDKIKKTDYNEYENRYSLQFSYKFKIADKVNASISQTTEARYYDKETEDHIRLRLRLNLDKKFRIDNRQSLAPYISPELFYDDIRDEIYRSRLHFGAKYYFCKSHSILLGMILQNQKDKAALLILNTGINLSF